MASYFGYNSTYGKAIAGDGNYKHLLANTMPIANEPLLTNENVAIGRFQPRSANARRRLTPQPLRQLVLKGAICYATEDDANWSYWVQTSTRNEPAKLLAKISKLIAGCTGTAEPPPNSPFDRLSAIWALYAESVGAGEALVWQPGLPPGHSFSSTGIVPPSTNYITGGTLNGAIVTSTFLLIEADVLDRGFFGTSLLRANLANFQAGTGAWTIAPFASRVLFGETGSTYSIALAYGSGGASSPPFAPAQFTLEAGSPQLPVVGRDNNWADDLHTKGWVEVWNYNTVPPGPPASQPPTVPPSQRANQAKVYLSSNKNGVFAVFLNKPACLASRYQSRICYFLPWKSNEPIANQLELYADDWRKSWGIFDLAPANDSNACIQLIRDNVLANYQPIGANGNAKALFAKPAELTNLLTNSAGLSATQSALAQPCATLPIANNLAGARTRPFAKPSTVPIAATLYLA